MNVQGGVTAADDQAATERQRAQCADYQKVGALGEAEAAEVEFVDHGSYPSIVTSPSAL